MALSMVNSGPPKSFCQPMWAEHAAPRPYCSPNVSHNFRSESQVFRADRCSSFFKNGPDVSYRIPIVILPEQSLTIIRLFGTCLRQLQIAERRTAISTIARLPL